MRLIDADEFRKELLKELKNDCNMYYSLIEKEIRDEMYWSAIERLDEQPTVKEDV